MKRPTNNRELSARPYRSLWIVVLAISFLAGCGGGSSSSSSQASGVMSGNWQFALASPPDNSFEGGIQGGGLLQNGGGVGGAVTYSVALPQPGAPPKLCSSGSAPVSGTITGANVELTVVAGSQTFTLTGKLSGDHSTLTGTYSSTDGKGCGTAQSQLQWSAKSVPPLSGSVQGSFHSVTSNPNPPQPPVSNQAFSVTGMLSQGENIGASNATITGTLIFQAYPCLDPDPQPDPITGQQVSTISVNGQISGNSVVLQLFALNGLNVGQIGAPSGFQNPGPVSFESTQGGGYVLHGANGYGMTTKNCPGGNLPGDVGNICLALGGAVTCDQPLLLSPASVVFPPQPIRSIAGSQTVTLTNISSATLDELAISLREDNGPFGTPGDFTSLPNFSEQDSCAASPGATFSLAPQQSCSITVSFLPQQSCPWIPFGAPPTQAGAAPAFCPFPLAARLMVHNPKTADGNPDFAVPVTGIGLSSITPSTAELDFGSVAPGEASPSQTVTFTNQGLSPVQILPALSTPCQNPDVGVNKLSRPLVPGSVSAFQVLTGTIIPDVDTIDYLCDSDLASKQSNFQVSSDSCSGTVLGSLDSCSIEVAFVPQPSTAFIPALDYFLELNTLQCTSDVTSNCELDSGRFPVELKANTPSPLRMTPGAGLDFGKAPVGQITDPPLTITLFNDPNDPNPGVVNFTGNVVKGDYIETDDCGSSLAPGHSCTLNISFKPKIAGFDPGTITIGYQIAQTQTIYLRGTGVVQ